MFWLKSCPHCLGDLYEGKDLYGWYVACLQCGHYLEEAEELILRCLPQWDAETRPWQEPGRKLVTTAAPDADTALQVAA